MNPWLSSLVSFLPIIAALGLVWICLPKPVPSADSLSQMPGWAPLGGLIGAFAVVAGLLFVGKVGAGAFAGLTITANILMSLVIDKFGPPSTQRLSANRAGWVSAIPLSLVVVMGALLSIRSHFLLRHDRELIVHSFEVIRAADDVLIGSLDAETGQRGFVITGNRSFLVPCSQATQAIPAALKQLMNLVGDNAKQLTLIYALKGETDSKLGELHHGDPRAPSSDRSSS